TVGNSTTVRLDELLFLESGQYTITTYGNYEIRAQIFNTAGDYKRSVDVGKNTYTTILFDEDVNAGIYIRLYGESSENENINPSMGGNELLIKVEKGEKSSDWAPKPSDILDGLDSKADLDNVYVKADIDGMFDNVVSQEAYQIDKDGFIERFKGNETQIEQNIEEIGLRVKETEYNADKDGFIDRFNSNESAIEVNAREIGLRVKETDYDDEMGKIDNRICGREVEIGEIDLSVETLRGDFDNLENGGRNLLKYSDFTLPENVDTWTPFGANGNMSTADINGYTFLHVRSSSDIKEGDNYTVRTPYHLNLNKDGSYTVSWLGASSTHADFNRAGFMKSGYFFGTLTPSSVKSEKVVTTDIFGYQKNIYRYWGTIELGDPEDEELYFFVRYINNSDSTSWFFVGEPQVEEGNKRTPYAPNPTDALDYTRTQIKLLEEVIKLDFVSYVELIYVIIMEEEGV